MSSSPYGAGLAYGGTTSSLFSHQNMIGAMLDSHADNVRYQINWQALEKAVSTTSNTGVAQGIRTITPAVMLSGFQVGNLMQCQTPTSSNFEQVVITAKTSATVTARFLHNHAVNFPISAAQPGDTPASAPTRVLPYDWSVMDDLVTTAASNHFNIVFPLQNAPAWHQAPLACDATRSVIAATDIGVFLTALLQRYAPGTFFALEAGNEGFNTPTLCSAMFTSQALPLLQTCHAVIQQYSPTTLLGAPAQLNKDILNVPAWIADFYAAGCAPYVDYLNFHYYSGTRAPDAPATGNTGFTAFWQAIHAASVMYGDLARKIWLTEFGWTLLNNAGNNGGIADATLTSYMSAALNSAAYSGCIDKVFYFNLGQIAPHNGANQDFTKQSYQFWKGFIQQHAQFNTLTNANALMRTGTANATGHAGNALARGTAGTGNALSISGLANAILEGG